MFLADTLEPTARAIADLIVQSGAPISGAWNGYVKEEDLIPLRQTQDDVLEFTRAAGKGDHKGYARLKLFNIHSVDPDPGNAGLSSARSQILNFPGQMPL